MYVYCKLVAKECGNFKTAYFKRPYLIRQHNSLKIDGERRQLTYFIQILSIRYPNIILVKSNRIRIAIFGYKVAILKDHP